MVILSILGFFAVILFGYLLVNLFIPKSSILERISLGYLMGFGLFTYVIFIASLYRVVFKLQTLSTILILLIGILLLINRFFKRKLSFSDKLKVNLHKKNIEFKRLSVLGKISLACILISILSIFIYNFYWPLRGTDAFALYDFRAKSFVATGSMDDAIARSNFVVYPLFTSLSHTWLYLTGFSNVMFFYALIYISFSILFFISLRKFVSVDNSLIITAVMMSFPDLYGQAQLAYTNLPYTVFLVLGSIYLYLGIRFKKNGYIWVSMILTMLSCWTRNIEPLWLINVIVMIVYGLFRKRNLLTALIYALVVNLFRLPWNNFYEENTDSVLNIKNQITGGGRAVAQGIVNGINVDEFLHYFYYYAIRPYVVLYFILFIILLYKIFSKNREWWLLLIFAGYISLLFLSTYVFILTFPSWKEIPMSFQRLVMFLIPLMIFIIATEFEKLTKNLELYEK